MKFSQPRSNTGGGSGFTSAVNGLYSSGSTVKMGGDLTQTTQVTNPNGKYFSLGNSNTPPATLFDRNIQVIGDNNNTTDDSYGNKIFGNGFDNIDSSEAESIQFGHGSLDVDGNSSYSWTKSFKNANPYNTIGAEEISATFTPLGVAYSRNSYHGSYFFMVSTMGADSSIGTDTLNNCKAIQYWYDADNIDYFLKFQASAHENPYYPSLTPEFGDPIVAQDTYSFPASQGTGVWGQFYRRAEYNDASATPTSGVTNNVSYDDVSGLGGITRTIARDLKKKTEMTIKNIDPTYLGYVTVVGENGDLFDGQSSIILAPYQCITIKKSANTAQGDAQDLWEITENYIDTGRKFTNDFAAGAITLGVSDLGKTTTNSTGQLNVILPPISSVLSGVYSFMCGHTDGMTIFCDGADTMSIAGSRGGQIDCVLVDNTLTLQAINNVWTATSIVGTWTIQ